jgi:hypothetical protein
MWVQTPNIFFTFRTTYKPLLNIDNPDVYVQKSEISATNNNIVIFPAGRFETLYQPYIALYAMKTHQQELCLNNVIWQCCCASTQVMVETQVTVEYCKVTDWTLRMSQCMASIVNFRVCVYSASERYMKYLIIG